MVEVIIYKEWGGGEKEGGGGGGGVVMVGRTRLRGGVWEEGDGGDSGDNQAGGK